MTGSILPTKILVIPEKKKDKVTESGIILSASVGKSPNISGVVQLCGSGTELVPMPVKEGNTVLFYERSAQPVRIEEQDLFLLDCREILFYF